MADKDKYGIINLTHLEEMLSKHRVFLKVAELGMNSPKQAIETVVLLEINRIKEQCELLPSAEEVWKEGFETCFNGDNRANKTFDQFIEKYKKP